MFDSYKRDKELALIDEEIPHKRKRESSTSHSSARSKHKHQYKPCKLTYSDTYDIPGKDSKIYTFCRLMKKVSEAIDREERNIIRINYREFFKCLHI